MTTHSAERSRATRSRRTVSRMKRLGALLAATVAAVLLTATHADARGSDHSPGVVTPWEYNHAQVGQTYHHIAHAFGTKGRTLGLYPAGMVVKYRASDGTHVFVTFSFPAPGEKARLVSKSRGD
jgi:hypothetical protein